MNLNPFHPFNDLLEQKDDSYGRDDAGGAGFAARRLERYTQAIANLSLADLQDVIGKLGKVGLIDVATTLSGVDKLHLVVWVGVDCPDADSEKRIKNLLVDLDTNRLNQIVFQKGNPLAVQYIYDIDLPWAVGPEGDLNRDLGRAPDQPPDPIADESRATYKAAGSYKIKAGDTVELFGGTVFKDIKRTGPRSPQFEGIVVKLGDKPGKLKVGERGTFAASNIAKKLQKND